LDVSYTNKNALTIVEDKDKVVGNKEFVMEYDKTMEDISEAFDIVGGVEYDMD
jgi:hypothetical protein